MNFDQLVSLCRDTHQRFVTDAARTIDTHLVARNFILGLYIVHYEQEGEDRAAYGKQTLKALSTALKTVAGRGFSVDNLELMRRFYIHFRSEILMPEISETPSRISNSHPSVKSETLSRKSEESPWLALPSPEILGKLPSTFTLGWSHYVELLTLAAHLLPAPTVRSKQAQGIALGDNPKMIQALKGRPKPCHNHSPVCTSISSSAPRIVNDSSPAMSAILSMPTWQPSCKTGAVPRCSSILSKTMFTSCSIWHAPSPSVPRSRRSKKPRQNGSRRRAQRLPVSPGRPDMARLLYPSPTFQSCAITSPDNKSITGRSHSKKNTEPSWCDTELISMNDTSGINAPPWAAPSGLHSLSSARPRALPWAGMVCPVGVLEVARLEQITHELEGGETP